jgi:hypothetical protein
VRLLHGFATKECYPLEAIERFGTHNGMGQCIYGNKSTTIRCLKGGIATRRTPQRTTLNPHHSSAARTLSLGATA